MNKILSFVLVFVLILSIQVAAYAPKSTDALKAAFAEDGFDVTTIITFDGKRGMIAEHRTAFNYETKEKKKVYYIEGNGYQMGYLMGQMAPDAVALMTSSFIDNVLRNFISDFIDPDKIPNLMKALRAFTTVQSQKILPDIPQYLVDEMQGIVDGCQAAGVTVKFEDVVALNVGFDCILSYAYALNQVPENERFMQINELKIPIMCNAISVFGNATQDGRHYFGRDFMFPPGDAFEYVGCLIVYCPEDGRLPMVGMAAPGFVGNIAGMNIEGLSMGVDMSPANNCDPHRPGLNSLPIVRHIMHHGTSAEHAVDLVTSAQRGVSWLYMIADGKNDRSVVIESGHSTDNLDHLSYVLQELKELNLVPDQAYLDEKETQLHQKGLMLRWNDYQYPQNFRTFNNDLFEHNDKTLHSSMLAERGYINPTYNDANCPMGYYFAPQRENKDDVLIMSNHCIVPSMRLCAMHPWVTLLAGYSQNDIQWRYDELNNQILESYGQIDEIKARNIIDFLAPYNRFPEYYKDSKKSPDGLTTVVDGSVSLCNLTDKVIHSHYGYYADEWVTISLLNYFD